MRVIIYGLGKHFKKNMHNIRKNEVVAICDSDKKKSEEWFCLDKPFILPEQIVKIDYEFIVVSSFDYFFEISHNLIFEYGVDVEKIISLDYYLSLNYNEHHENVYIENCKYIAKKTFINARLLNVGSYNVDYFSNENIDFLHGKDALRILKSDKIKTGESIYNINGILATYLNNQTLGIYVVSHKDITEINAGGYYTIYVGEKGETKAKCISDSTMDNISYYNSIINECTALYWIWKNDNSRFVGLNHYRRFLGSLMNRGWMIQEWEVYQILKNNDIIVAERSYFENKTITDQLREAVDKDAFATSYKCLIEIFNNMSKEEQDALDRFFNLNYFFPCQLFIMSRTLLEDYCQWLFPILFSLIEGVPIKSEWDDYSKRIIGFWAERLFTVWIMLRKHRIAELPIIMI